MLEILNSGIQSIMGSPENTNLLLDFDYVLTENLTDPGGDLLLPPLDPPHLACQSHSFTAPTALSVDREDAFTNSDDLKENGYRKWVRSPSCNASGSKACREKIRRNKLNDRFIELASILGSRRPPKMDKVAILGDAVRTVKQLQVEAQNLKGSNEELQEKINELKAEKNELREEKQMLKTEKDSLDMKIKGLNAQPGFLHRPAMVAPFSGPGQFVGNKLVPFIGYPGASMWQFMPSTAFDSSQDHVMRPPAA